MMPHIFYPLLITPNEGPSSMDDDMKRALRLDRQDVQESIGAKRAEIISRLWQAIAFLEEVRADLGNGVRMSPAREQASIAITSSTQQLVLAAGILAPKSMRPEATAETEPAKGISGT
jgi:hypothetical protein